MFSCLSHKYVLSVQGTLEHVEGGRISNKKYDAELLHPVTKAAVAAQGIPEAYNWLEACVAEEDISVGRALEQTAKRGTLGRLHELGAGRRVASVYVMEPSPHLSDQHRFWRLPEDVLALPLVYDEARPLPRVRYKDPRQVPVASIASDASDSDDRPLVLRRPVIKASPGQKRKRADEKAASKRKKAEEKAASKLALTVEEVRDGRFVVTHDDFGTDEKSQPGFSVCKIVGGQVGTAERPAWSFKHLLSSTPPHLKGVVTAKFGIGKGAVVDALDGDVIPFYTIVAAFDRLNRNCQLPLAMRNVIKQHRDWAALE
jgi:hypothetical protein